MRSLHEVAEDAHCTAEQAVQAWRGRVSDGPGNLQVIAQPTIGRNGRFSDCAR
jgi:hypothetical protein